MGKRLLLFMYETIPKPWPGEFYACIDIFCISWLFLIEWCNSFQGARNEIFAMKPAPIQVSYMGFPGTTGASYIDYLVTDEVIRTGCYEAIHKFLYLLSNSFTCFLNYYNFSCSLFHLFSMHIFTLKRLSISRIATL